MAWKMKKKFYSLTIALLASIASFGQTQNWLWAKSMGGSNSDYGQSVATDVKGNVYITGYFSSPSITFGSTVLTNAGKNDFFIAKYDSIGNPLWAKSAGGNGDDKGFGITTDKNGNIFVTGNFESSSIKFDNITLANSGFFIVKYNASGNVLWAKDAGGHVSHINGGNCIATDTSGNVCVTGSFFSTLTFGSTTLSNTGNPDIYVAKYDASGNALWAKQGNGGLYDSDYGNGIATDVSGNIYIVGGCGSNTDFGVYWGLAGFFVVKYDSSGNPLWIQGAGGSGGGTGSGITVTNGMVYITGWFTNSTITVGPYSTTNTNTGTTDILLAMFYASNGNSAGVWSVGGNNDDKGFDIASDNKGNIYVTGSFHSSSIAFPYSNTLTNTGGYDIFVAKYPASFSWVTWVRQAGGSTDDNAQSIAVDTSGHTYVTGDFALSPVFDNDTLKAASRNIFTAKLGCEPLQPKSIIGSTNICRNSSHTYSVSVVPNATSYTWNFPLGWTGNSTTNSTTTISSSSSGIISVVANNSCGCSRSRTLFVTVNPTTPTITTTGSTTFCQGGSVLLSSSSANSYLWSNGTVTQSTTIFSSGNYSITTTDINGCSATSATTNITVNSNPPKPTIAQASNILFSSAAIGNQWYLNSNPIESAIGQVYIPTQSGNYSVCTTNNNGCSSCSTPYNIYTGISENENENLISISPNPFTVETILKSNIILKRATLTIDNCFGQTVKEIRNISSQTIILLRDNLPCGLYFIQLTQDNKKIATKKVIITN
jgi:hypothetical protein